MTELEARRVDRKGFVAAGALAALMASGAGRFAADAFAASGTLLYYNWADYVNPKTYELFTKATGVKVKKDFYVSNETLQAKLKAGARGYDLAVPTGYMVQILASDGLLKKIDYSKLPNVKKNIDAKFRGLPYDPKDTYSVPKDWGTTGFAYRKDLIKERPTTWKQFFNLMKTKYSGKVTLLDGSPEVIGSVAISLGYSYNTESQSELDKVRKFLLDLKKHVHSIDSVAYKQNLVGGKTVMAQAWNGDGAFVASKKPAEYVVPAEGAEFWVDAYVIPEGAKNPDAAHAWINFCFGASINALETSYTYYGSPLKRSVLQGKLAKSILNNPDVFPPASVLKKLEANKISAKGTRLRERIWTEFKAA